LISAALAALQRSGHPDLVAVGVFGSYGRSTAGVGSDLDLLRRWLASSLPLACDLLVYSH
jgi:predicted nucleotidyltransferase